MRAFNRSFATGIAMGLVIWRSNEVNRGNRSAFRGPTKRAVLIGLRIRKSRMYVQHRKHCELERSIPLSPGEKTIRRVEGQSPALVRINDGYGAVTEELIEVIQIPKCL